MKKKDKRKNHHRGPLLALAGITSMSALVCLLAYIADFAGSDVSLSQVIYHSVASGSLGGLPEVIAGILGISITVVAIIVELASNRYTARITELFMESIPNLLILSFFVVTGVLSIWLSLVTGSQEVLPKVGIIVSVCMVVACLLILLPYFAFVFNFLNPHNIIDRMASSVFSAVRKGGTSVNAHSRLKRQTNRGIEQLADVASGAIENKDKVVCMHAVNTLGGLTQDYLGVKSTFTQNWFSLDSNIKENPDFVSMQDDVLEQIEQGRYWLEMKVLRQYQMLYGESVNRMRDINYLIAINTRKIAKSAMEKNDAPIVSLCVKFFNTYMRATINSRDVRTAYNVFNQYRLLAQTAIEMNRDDVAIEIAERFKYYGQLGFSMGLSFVLETAAYDLCDLNELAFARKAQSVDKLLEIFLDVDKEAEEGHALEASLRGVRKAQIKLATYYLTNDSERLARVIFDDMRDELPSRLNSIHDEFTHITSKDFWEISDRGGNFDYLDKSRRNALETFFTWFK